MPSRERVVTTITTALDEENGKDVVISETVEIQSARCAQTDQNPPSKLNAPVAASPSPQKNQPKSNSQLRKKREINVPGNQRTLSSFFKPKAEKKHVQNSENPLATLPSKISQQEKTLVSPRISVSEVLTDNAMKPQTTLSAMPCTSKTLKMSSLSECSSSPSNNSDKSSHHSFVAPMEEIISIVLGAHDEASFNPSPVTSTTGMRKVRGLDVKAILPSMVVCHDFSQCDEAVKSKHINAEQKHCENVSTKRKVVSPQSSSTDPQTSSSIVASESNCRTLHSRKKVKIIADKAQHDTKFPLPETINTENSSLQENRTNTQPASTVILPGTQVNTANMQIYPGTDGKNATTPSKESFGETKGIIVDESAIGEMKISTVNRLQPRKKNPTGETNPTVAGIAPPDKSCNVGAEVASDINREGKIDVKSAEKTGIESKEVKATIGGMNDDTVNNNAVNRLQPRKKNPTGKSNSTVAATITPPSKSCNMNAEVDKNISQEEKVDMGRVEKVGIEAKDTKSTIGDSNNDTVNRLQPRKKNPSGKSNTTVVATITPPSKSCAKNPELAKDIFHEKKVDVGLVDKVGIESKDVKSTGGNMNSNAVNRLQPRKKNPTGKSNSAVAATITPPGKSYAKDDSEGFKAKEICREGKFDVVCVAKVGKEARDAKSTVGDTNDNAVNLLQTRKKNSMVKTNPTVLAVEPAGDAEVVKDMNREGKSEVACVKKVGKEAKDVKSAIQRAQISPEDSSLLVTYDNMRSKYMERMNELVQRVVHRIVEEEEFQNHLTQTDFEVPEATNTAIDNGANEFKDEWLHELSLIVQGSSLPVDALARVAQNKIISVFGADTVVSFNALVSKIKVIAIRTQYLFPFPECSDHLEAKVDIFSNTNPELMWRWELISLDLLPDKLKSTVKSARSVRRKLKSQQKAIIKLIQSIDDAASCIKSMSDPSKKQILIAKVSVEEEKVLKYEREEEKARILNDAKRQREIQKAIAKQQRDLEKKRQDDEKRKEKERQDEIRKAEKAQKLEEKEKKKKEENDRKAAVEEKQKSRMLSFFKKPPQSPKVSSSVNVHACAPVTLSVAKTSSFDSHEFWRQLGVGECDMQPFAGKLTSKAKQSKMCRVGRANVRVFVPTVSDNPFDQQVYDEERTISIRNKYKFLSFREDYRPPYHGTWSKSKSRAITGRNPFAKDCSYLDYDVDSEAEWEEGDDEQGEDCSDNGNDEEEAMDDEEGDITKYNYHDGWLAEDGDLELEDDDEETHELRKRKIVQSDTGSFEGGKTSKLSVACVIAPSKGGIPLIFSSPKKVSDFVEGIEVSDALELMSLQSCEILPSEVFCLEPFPPSSRKVSIKKTDQSQKIAPQEMSRSDLITFAKFVHNSTLKSKDLVIEELRNAHKHITSSRAQATRKLDSIAEKRRLKNGAGVIWEVKNEILESLGLHELIKTSEIVDSTASKGKDTDSESKASESGKGTKNKAACVKNELNNAHQKATEVAEIEKAQSGNEEKLMKCDEAQKVALATSPNAVIADNSVQTCKSPSKKRKAPSISQASANLLASFLKKKKVSNS